MDLNESTCIYIYLHASVFCLSFHSFSPIVLRASVTLDLFIDTARRAPSIPQQQQHPMTISIFIQPINFMQTFAFMEVPTYLFQKSVIDHLYNIFLPFTKVEARNITQLFKVNLTARNVRNSCSYFIIIYFTFKYLCLP